MKDKVEAVLMGPFVGEMYWEAGRFAPMLPHMINKTYKDRDVKYIILTREERFDLYGNYADVLVPLRIPGDYDEKQPNCFRLNNLTMTEYKDIADKFNAKYNKRFKILKHIYPDVKKGQFLNKNQFPKNQMQYSFQPRIQNYELMEEYLPKDDKPLVVISPRFRKGFKRNWRYWPDFYDRLANDKTLMENFNFIVCGKKGEYIPDRKNRFLDMNHVTPTGKSSTVGLLLVVLEKAMFTFGSQSAIPNLSLLYRVPVLTFGCQKTLHTKTYNIHKTPITFIDDRNYSIAVKQIFPKFKSLITKENNDARNKKRMALNEEKRNRGN